MLGELFTLLITSVLINDVVLNQFLGICPFMGVSKKASSAIGMGLAVVFVIVAASIVTFGLYYLVPGTAPDSVYGPDHVHSRHRFAGAADGDVHQKDEPFAVSVAGVCICR